MIIRKLSAVLIASTILASCGANIDINNPGLRAGPPPAPTAGFIVYLTDEFGGSKLVRQDMNGMAKDGAPHILSGVNGKLNNDIRYPGVTPDGRFIYFTERKSYQAGTGLHDEFVVADNRGQVVWSSRSAGCSDVDMNYPELVSYSYDTANDQLSFQLAGACAYAGNWVPFGFTATKIENNPVVYAGDPDYWGNSQPNGAHGPSGGVETATVPEAAPTQSSNDYVRTIHTDTDLSYTSLWTGYPSIGNMPTDQCPGGPNISGLGKVYVNEASKVDAGFPSNFLSPNQAYTVKKAFAPSMSSDGKYVLFNSDVYENEPRGEELMLINLPDDLCANYRIISYPKVPGQASKLPSVPFKSTITVLNSGSGDEYASFAANIGYSYVMHRNNDPAAGGRKALYIAPNLADPAVRLNPGSAHNETEGAWFYQ